MFIPKDFEIPQGYQTADFLVRPLLIADVVKDYDAVMSSVDRLRGVFGPESLWPAADLSFEQDLIDLGWHHKEFQRRTSFAYTVFMPDNSWCLGCAYIYPSAKTGYDAVAYCWVRSDSAHLDQALYESFRSFIAEKWPFQATAFPGRDPSWELWTAA